MSMQQKKRKHTNLNEEVPVESDRERIIRLEHLVQNLSQKLADSVEKQDKTNLLLAESVKQQKRTNAQMGVVCDVTVEPRIRNIVGELLLFLIGEQPRKKVYFKYYKTAEHSELLNAIHHACVPEYTSSVAVLMNMLIAKRNDSVHAKNYEQLTKRINHLLTHFEVFPHLKRAMSVEHSLLTKWGIISQHLIR